MSLLCGCTSRQSSPKQRKAMSKIKAPSASSGGSRFGFNRSSPPNKTSSPSSQNSSSSNSRGTTDPSGSSPLSNGLTLSPTSLLENSVVSSNENPSQVSVPVMQQRPSSKTNTKSKPRPMSSIVTISGCEDGMPEGDNLARTVDDTNMSGKPKSGLRSFLARPFNRNSFSHRSNENGKTGGASHNSAALENSQRAASRKSDGQSPGQRKPAPQTKLATPGRSSPISHSKSASGKSSGASKTIPYASQFRPSPKHDQADGCTSTSIGLGANKNKASRNELASNSNIDSQRLKGRHENGHISSGAAVGASTVSSTQAAKANDSNTSLSSSTDCRKAKPTIEIIPLAKRELSSQADSEAGDKDSNGHRADTETEDTNPEMGLTTAKRFSPNANSRKYQVNEAALNAMLSEVVALRKALTELQHHLIGKQEYEDKMREELKQKDELIFALHNQLACCMCTGKSKDLAHLNPDGKTQVVES